MSQQLRRRVEQFIRAHGMFETGDSVVVGCSGGPDSTCLLHVLATGFASLRLRFTAVYVDHGLRPGVEAERELVRRNAQAVGADFAWRSVDVPERLQERGGSTQAVARELRYAALREVACQAGAAKIAVGHTLDDQAETVLLQLLRGSGTQGLAGIAPVRGRIVRPLLEVRREETVRYCKELGLETVDDPSNQSVVYMRNRVRLELLPELRTYNPAIDERLADLAEISRAEDAYLHAEALRAAESLVHRHADGGDAGVWIDAPGLSGLPLALARRVVRIAASKLGVRSLAFAHVAQILEAARRSSGSEVLDNVPALHVRREYDRLMLMAPESLAKGEGKGERVALPVPGSVHVGWAGLTIETQVLGESEIESAARRALMGRDHHRAVIDLDAVAPPIYVRRRRPGDRIAPLGLGGRKKLQDLLTDAKVPRSLRDRVAVVEDRRGIFWVVGHALDERVRLRDGTKRALCLVARGSGPQGASR